MSMTTQSWPASRFGLGMAAAVALLGCDSGDADFIPCQDICSHLVECGAEPQISDCMEGCAATQSMLAARYFQALGQCAMAEVCNAHVIDDCMLEVASTAPPSIVEDYFLVPICERVIECRGDAPTMDVHDCVQETGGVSEEMMLVAVFNQDILECAARCFRQVSCSAFEAAEGGWAAACMDGCLAPKNSETSTR